MTQTLLFLPRLLALTVVLVLAHIVGAAAVGLGASAPKPAVEQVDPAPVASEAADTASPPVVSRPRTPDIGASLQLLAIMLGVCFLEALAIGVLLQNARAHSWKLIGGLWVPQLGVLTLQPQIEALAFGVVRSGTAFRIIGMGVVMATLVAPLSTLVFWRVRPGDDAHLPAPMRSWRSVRSWMLVVGAGVVYVALYLVFGYFIAWRSPEVRAYYGGEESTGFFSHLWRLQSRMSWFLPFQFLRGCLWAVLGWVMLTLLRAPWWRAGLVVGFFFAVMMNAQLLLPNRLMPETVRLVHILETAPCNLLFGFVLARILRGAPRDGA